MEEIIDIDIDKPKEPKQTASKSSGESDDNPAYWKLVLLRNTRNSYLALTDKYLLPDFPITDEKKEIIINYRQYLRDFINTNSVSIMNGIEVEIDPIPTI